MLCSTVDCRRRCARRGCRRSRRSISSTSASGPASHGSKPRACHELGFLERAENAVLLGMSEVGKTDVAISLAIAAAESGRKVR